MREKANPEQDPTLGVPVPWDVVEVHALPGFRLSVRFADGIAGEVDMSRIILGSDAGVFAALRDHDTFAKVGIDDGAVTWPGEIDVAPDAMHDEIAAHGFWAPE